MIDRVPARRAANGLIFRNCSGLVGQRSRFSATKTRLGWSLALPSGLVNSYDLASAPSSLRCGENKIGLARTIPSYCGLPSSQPQQVAVSCPIALFLPLQNNIDDLICLFYLSPAINYRADRLTYFYARLQFFSCFGICFLVKMQIMEWLRLPRPTDRAEALRRNAPGRRCGPPAST